MELANSNKHFKIDQLQKELEIQLNRVMQSQELKIQSKQEQWFMPKMQAYEDALAKCDEAF